VTKVTKAGVARDVWQMLVGYFFARRDLHMRVVQELGLTPGHMKTLFELDAEEGRSMGELATALVCDASNATWLVDRLEERGLVERRSRPHDRRVKTVVLTPDGVKTKELLIERLSAPPEDLVAMDRADLDRLHEALALLPPSPPFWVAVPPVPSLPDGADPA
jgi:DNA-binding MarR family transcriptional regulator